MRKSSVDNKNITTYDKREYYRTILATWGKGYRYEIQGPETTRIDGGNNYSFRWGTDKEYIESVLEAEGLNYTGQHDIVNFRLRLYTSEPIVFNTVVPCCESEKKFSVPMWFGNQIGVVNLPVTASKLDITGDGTDDILYDFKWNENYFPSGYLDERDFDDYPYNTPGFAVRYFMDTAPSIDTGVAKINFNGYFKYRSLVNKYSLLLHEYTEITHKNYYFIDIVE
ncbi:hypothetical protein ETC00_13515 [Brevibacillus sp. MCWH]|nr:hypothetical protein [Brevibacillus sp. MCWH]